MGAIDGQWQLTARLEKVVLGVSESLRQIIVQQIEQLPTEEQRVLEAASVVGKEFSAAVVAAGLEEEVERVERWCEELVRRGQFLRSSGVETLPNGTVAERYGFSYSLYQNVLYDRLGAA